MPYCPAEITGLELLGLSGVRGQGVQNHDFWQENASAGQLESSLELFGPLHLKSGSEVPRSANGFPNKTCSSKSPSCVVRNEGYACVLGRLEPS